MDSSSAYFPKGPSAQVQSAAGFAAVGQASVRTFGAFRSGPISARPASRSTESHTGATVSQRGAPSAASKWAIPAFATVSGTGALSVAFPAASYARATSVAVPFGSRVESQVNAHGEASQLAMNRPLANSSTRVTPTSSLAVAVTATAGPLTVTPLAGVSSVTEGRSVSAELSSSTNVVNRNRSGVYAGSVAGARVEFAKSARAT